MDYNFADVMSKKTDNELISILTANREDYAPKAIDAAQAEFEKRNIDSAKIESVRAREEESRKIRISRANEPLEKDVKVLAIIVPIVARLIYARKFREGGYDRKLSELISVFFMSRIILLGVIVLIIIIYHVIT